MEWLFAKNGYRKTRWNLLLPSFEVENKESKNGLAISAVGDPNNYEFYIFYKRPKNIKPYFGLKEKINENYSTDIQGQTKNDVLDCLKALIRNDTVYLENKVGHWRGETQQATKGYWPLWINQH